MSGSDEKSKPHLRIIKSDEAEEPEPSDMQVKLDADAILGNAVMYAAMSWVSCCMEEQGEAVSVMPLSVLRLPPSAGASQAPATDGACSGGLFDAEVRLVGGRSIWLRVRLVLEAGPVLQTRIEPVHP